MLADLVNWIQNYEQTVIETHGIDYRTSTLMEWDNGERRVTAPQEVVGGWGIIGAVISKMQYVNFE